MLSTKEFNGHITPPNVEDFKAIARRLKHIWRCDNPNYTVKTHPEYLQFWVVNELMNPETGDLVDNGPRFMPFVVHEHSE